VAAVAAFIGRQGGLVAGPADLKAHLTGPQDGGPDAAPVAAQELGVLGQIHAGQAQEALGGVRRRYQILSRRPYLIDYGIDHAPLLWLGIYLKPSGSGLNHLKPCERCLIINRNER
jgi:hypothetical protein